MKVFYGNNICVSFVYNAFSDILYCIQLRKKSVSFLSDYRVTCSWYTLISTRGRTCTCTHHATGGFTENIRLPDASYVHHALGSILSMIQRLIGHLLLVLSFLPFLSGCTFLFLSLASMVRLSCILCLLLRVCIKICCRSCIVYLWEVSIPDSTCP